MLSYHGDMVLSWRHGLIMETWSYHGDIVLSWRHGLIKPFSSLYDQKSQDKNLNILRTKGDFNVKYKVFLIIFKGLSLNYTKNSFQGESPTLAICLLPQNQFKGERKKLSKI